MIAIIMKKAKVHLPVRVHEVVKRIVEIETVARKLSSPADFVEIAIYLAATSTEARKLMLETIQQNGGTSAILSSLGLELPAISSDQPASSTGNLVEKKIPLGFDRLQREIDAKTSKKAAYASPVSRMRRRFRNFSSLDAVIKMARPNHVPAGLQRP